jgi:acid phosphatase type 7
MKSGARSGRAPDLVLAGHVHNYQRFTRTLDQDGANQQIPYIAAGSGGYWHLHTIASDAKAVALPWVLPGHDDIQLNAWVDDRYGFLRVEATPTQLTVTSFTVPRPQEPWGNPPAVADTFTLDRTTHSVRLAG